MIHILGMIRSRHPQQAHQIIAILLFALALTLLAGVILLLY